MDSRPFSRESKIYIAGHRGLVGSAVKRQFQKAGYDNIVTRGHAELELTDQAQVKSFFGAEKPDAVVLCAAKVGGIMANSTYPAEFIQINLAIQTNVIHQAWKHGVKRLIFMGSSCIYPRDCPQPIKEDYLLTGPPGDHQPSLCSGQDSRGGDVLVLLPPIRGPLHGGDAHQCIRAGRQL